MKVMEKKNVYVGALDLGMSDGAMLKVTSSWQPEYELNKNDLWFGEDGDYTAKVVSEAYEIPEYYTLVGFYIQNVIIVDDRFRGIDIMAPAIKIYRAGDFGCIIQLVGDVNVMSIHICACYPNTCVDYDNVHKIGAHVNFQICAIKEIDLV